VPVGGADIVLETHTAGSPFLHHSSETMSRTPHLLLLALCALFVPSGLAAPQEWPFGAAPGDALGGNRDLYNLGLLGAKATEAIRGEERASYVKRNADQVLGGHASLMQHYLFAGLAATAQGGAAEKCYWATVERDLLLALAPDGSFQPLPWTESLAMGSNSDASFGDVWTTACWCCVLIGDPPKKGIGGLPALLGE